MALKVRPGFAHVGAQLPEQDVREFAALRALLGVDNARLIMLGVDAVQREIASDPRPRKLPPLPRQHG
jgi:hypothetical protein